MKDFPTPAEPTATCSACGAPFHCGAKEEQCWCSALPPLKLLSEGACLCRDCLEKALARERT